MQRVEVRPELLRWARVRSGRSDEDVRSRIPQYDAWLSGRQIPTLRQLESFAKLTYTSVGHLLLSEPPDERLPITDLRTRPSARGKSPSPHLLDTIYRCQQRQAWYETFATEQGLPVVSFVGSARRSDDIEAIASEMRTAFQFGVEERRVSATWTDATAAFRQQVERAGVLIMANGIVGNNTSRKLDSEEFQGFALSSPSAPVVFVNAADSIAAQMFTISHEIAHLWLGATGVCDGELREAASDDIERWCEAVAAEFLVPRRHLQEIYSAQSSLEEQLSRLARQYKVSTFVLLRSIRDLGYLGEEEFWAVYWQERQKADQRRTPGSSGGDFYRTLKVRAGERFSRALIASTLEGSTTYTEALRLLDISKVDTFLEYSRRLGFNS